MTSQVVLHDVALGRNLVCNAYDRAWLFVFFLGLSDVILISFIIIGHVYRLLFQACMVIYRILRRISSSTMNVNYAWMPRSKFNLEDRQIQRTLIFVAETKGWELMFMQSF